MKKIIFLSLLITGTSAFLWQGDILPQVEKLMKSLSTLTTYVSVPTQSAEEVKKNLAKDLIKEATLDELEQEYIQLEVADLKKIINDATFNQKLDELILKSNLNELKLEEHNELALLIRKKAVIHKLLLDHELESFERENI